MDNTKAIQYYPKFLRFYRNIKWDYTSLYSFSHCEEGGSLLPTHYSDKGALKLLLPSKK